MVMISEYLYQCGNGNVVPRAAVEPSTDEDVEPVRLEERDDQANLLQL